VLADLVHIFDPTTWVAVHELTHVLTKIAGEGGIGSLPAWLRQWRRAEGRGLGIGERGAQSKFIFKYHQVLSEYLFFFVDRRVL